MAIHLGLIVLKGLSKTAFELALEYYVGKAIKSGDQYLVHHIDEICSKNKSNPDFSDTYAARIKGYCSIQEALKKIDESNSPLALEMKDLIARLHEEDDYIIVEQSDLHTNITLSSRHV
jgi:hypothetical protein